MNEYIDIINEINNNTNIYFFELLADIFNINKKILSKNIELIFTKEYPDNSYLKKEQYKIVEKNCTYIIIILKDNYDNMIYLWQLKISNIDILNCDKLKSILLLKINVYDIIKNN